MVEQLKQWLDKEPFVPFRIVLTSGGAYEVISPYQVAIGQTQLDYFYPRSDRTATLRSSQIASFETMEETKRRRSK